MDTEIATALDKDLAAFYREYPERFHPFLLQEQRALLAGKPNLEQIDKNTFALFSEILSARLGFDRDDIPQKKYYDCVCRQIYLFFSAKGCYAEEHFTAAALKEMLIATIAVQISQETGWNAALITAAVTLVLSAAIKVGIQAWCQYYEERHPEDRP